MKKIVMACCALVAAVSAFAQDYPHKPVRLIAPFAAGSGGDVLARLLAEGMGRQLQQSIYIENRGGASGTIGTQAVATAAPDGYTIGLGGMTTHVLAPTVFPKLAYDPVRSFAAIGRVGVSSIVLLATKDFPANNLAELAALAKARPGQQYGSWGPASTGHFCGEVLNQHFGTKMAHVSFGAKVIPSLLGGHLQLSFIDMVSATPMVKDGKLKALAVCTRRSPSLPGVQSYAEQGVAFDHDMSWALYAPAATPAAATARLAAALEATLKDPAVAERLLALGITADFMPGPQWAATVARAIPVWQKVARDSDIQVD